MGEVSVEANLSGPGGKVMPELKPAPPMTQTDLTFMVLTGSVDAAVHRGQ